MLLICILLYISISYNIDNMCCLLLNSDPCAISSVIAIVISVSALFCVASHNGWIYMFMYSTFWDLIKNLLSLKKLEEKTVKPWSYLNAVFGFKYMHELS